MDLTRAGGCCGHAHPYGGFATIAHQVPVAGFFFQKSSHLAGAASGVYGCSVCTIDIVQFGDTAYLCGTNPRHIQGFGSFPFYSFQQLTGNITRFYAPLIYKCLYGVSLDYLSPETSIESIVPRPIMLIHGTEDKEIPLDHAKTLLEKSGSSVVSWFVEGKDHKIFSGDSTGADNKAYRRMIWNFLTENIPAQGSVEYALNMMTNSLERDGEH